jgi:chaperonin GroES
MAMTASKPQKKSKKSINLQPIGDRIVVEREESEGVTSGGIYLPDTAKDKPARGTVISVGEGRMLKDGTRSKPVLKAGDRIIFTTYGPDEIKIGPDEYLLMREEDVLAIIED